MEEAWRKKAIAMALAFTLISMGCSASAGPSEMYETPNSMSFQECYAGCFILCAIQPTRTLSSCGFECLMDCIIPQNRGSNNNNSKILVTAFHFCSLGCASVQCTNISTLKNPGAKEVAGCVGSCSGSCRKNYMQTPPSN